MDHLHVAVQPNHKLVDRLAALRNGSAKLTIKVAPGALGKGVYTAMLVIQAVSHARFIDVPIILLVGDTSKIKIGGVGNAAID